jgi:hypothetical protein
MYHYNLSRKLTKLEINKEHIFYNTMIDSLPQCTKCGSSVTDSIEYEIEQHEKIKTGNYINDTWICSDCLGASRIQEEKKTERKEEEYSSSHTSQNNNSNNQCDNIGIASKSDVSPNTPRADEANL